MATMDVPQKKKGDMSRRRAPSCCRFDNFMGSPVKEQGMLCQHMHISANRKRSSHIRDRVMPQ